MDPIDYRPPKPFGPLSNNPGGRPRKTEEMRKGEALMRSKSEDGVAALIKLSEESEDDQVRARLLMFRYEAVFGKATQAITGAEGTPLLPTVSFKGVPDAELETFVTVATAISIGPADDSGSEGGTPTETSEPST